MFPGKTNVVWRCQAMEQLADAGRGTVSRTFGELVSGPRWKARVGTSGVQTLELDRLDVETACAVLELVQDQRSGRGRESFLLEADSGL